MCRLFILGESHGDARMGMARIFGLCVAFLFAPSVTAAVTIDLGPSEWRSFGPNGAHTPQGIRSSIGQTVRLPPNHTLNVTRNPVIPYGSVGGALRNIGRGTPQAIVASAAMASLFYAVDWVFEQGQWQKTGYETISEDLGGYYWYRNGFPGRKFSNPADLCNFYGERVSPEWNLESSWMEMNHSGTSGNCHGTFTVQGGPPFDRAFANTSRGGESCPAPYVYVPALGMCAVEGLVPLTDADYSELTGQLPALPAGDVASAAGDAQRQIGSPLPGYQDQTITGPSSYSGPDTTSTSTDPVTGDTIVTNTSTETAISYGDTTITTTDTTTSTTYQNGQETSTTVTTETPGELPASSGGGAGDWPGFCEWATVVCDWFDWTQEDPPPEQDLPAVIDDDFYQEKNISFGSKSCPPDHQIDLSPFLATSVAVSFQPLCDFAGLIYYMVMAASYIIAAYITIGVARNG